MMRYFYIFSIFCAACFHVVAQPGSIDQPSNVPLYLHIAHTRTSANPNMDRAVERLNYSIYDMLWLGGDMALSTSLDDLTMDHVDSILGLGSENTLWALGNHDYADLDRVQAYTGRPAYYAYHKNNITFLVLDSQDSLSNITGPQKELFFNVTDTIAESSHLIVLHHKLIWMYGDAYLQPQIPYITNGGFGDCFYCVNPNNFTSELYPELLKVEARGVEVICIAGDIGFRASKFEYLTPEGIQYLASGIEEGNPANKALLFQHDLSAGALSWEFVLLSDLPLSQDNSPPELHSIGILPGTINGGESIQITLGVKDSNSGLDQIKVDIVNPMGEQLHTISNHIGEWSLQGEHLYAFDLFIEDSAKAGTWQLSALTVIDSAGNELFLNNNDSVLATFVVSSPVGLFDTESFQAVLFPNPGTGIFYVPHSMNIEVVEVFDLTGRLLKKINNLKTNSIDLTGEPVGAYFIRLHISDGRILKNRVLIISENRH